MKKFKKLNLIISIIIFIILFAYLTMGETLDGEPIAYYPIFALFISGTIAVVIYLLIRLICSNRNKKTK